MSKAWARVSSRAWRRTRAAALLRDNYRCQIKGPRCTGQATCVDHITPLAQGGALHDMRNLRASCTTCNAQLSAQARARSTPKARPQPRGMTQW